MGQSWNDHERTLHTKYNVPQDRTIIALLGNGTVITLPRLDILNEHGQSSIEHVQAACTLLPPD